MRSFSILAFVFAFILPAGAMGPKIPNASVTFHIEGSKNDNPKMIFPYKAPGGMKYFERLPVCATKEIVSYKPFPAEDGSTGAVFTYNQVGANRLAARTTQSQGKWLMALINGTPTDVVLIDKPVRDGKIVIWKGLKQRDLDLIDLTIRREGVDAKTWKAQKKRIRERVKERLKKLARKKK